MDGLRVEKSGFAYKEIEVNGITAVIPVVSVDGNSGSSGIPEAPEDDIAYSRKNGEWVDIAQQGIWRPTLQGVNESDYSVTAGLWTRLCNVVTCLSSIRIINTLSSSSTTIITLPTFPNEAVSVDQLLPIATTGLINMDNVTAIKLNIVRFTSGGLAVLVAESVSSGVTQRIDVPLSSLAAGATLSMSVTFMIRAN